MSGSTAQVPFHIGRATTPIKKRAFVVEYKGRKLTTVGRSADRRLAEFYRHTGSNIRSRGGRKHETLSQDDRC